MSTNLLEVQGHVWQKGSEAYEKSRTSGFAANGNHSYPALIVQPFNVRDVQTCLQYAKQKSLQITVRSGGHNWFGTFLRDNVMLIDMSLFDDLCLDLPNREATVGPCTTGLALCQAAEPYGLHFPIGHCYGVSLGGYLLGGGAGWFVDYYGPACQYIVKAIVVAPGGDLLEISSETTSHAGESQRQQQQDWMYMLRGSASAFPGVLVSITIKLQVIPKIVRSNTMFFPASGYDEICTYLQTERMNGNLSDKVETVVVLGARPPDVAEAIPDAPIISICMVNVLADSEQEFEDITSLFSNQKTVFGHPYLPTTFGDTTISNLVKSSRNGYPRGFHYIIRHYWVDPELTPAIPFTKMRQELESRGHDTRLSILTCIMRPPVRPKQVIATTNSSSALVQYPGFLIGSECRYNTTTQEDKNDVVGSNGDLDSLLAFTASLAGLLEPLAVQFNPLEHPVDRETHTKCWKDADKLWQLRAKLDPQGLFFDPSKETMPNLYPK